MATNTPAEFFDDELLSAYVDGELSDDEHAQVEQRLREDPQARQLVAELRAISETLRSLPPQALGEDLRAAILQRAEHAGLLGDQPRPASVSVDTSKMWMGSARRWVWASLAVAAALLLSVYLPTTSQEDRPLAQAPPTHRNALRPTPELRTLADDSARQEERFAKAKPTAPPPAASPLAASAPASAVAKQTISGAEHRKAAKKARVEITFRNAQDGVGRFEQLLAHRGIATSDLKGPTASAESARAGSATVKRMVVEASPKQIEDLLMVFHEDRLRCASLRIVVDQSAAASLQKWRRFERLERDDRSIHPLQAQSQTPQPKESTGAFAPTDAAKTIRVEFVLHLPNPALK